MTSLANSLDLQVAYLVAAGPRADKINKLIRGTLHHAAFPAAAGKHCCKPFPLRSRFVVFSVQGRIRRFPPFGGLMSRHF